MNDWDQACRWMARVDARGILHWLLPVRPGGVRSRYLTDTRGAGKMGLPELVNDVASFVGKRRHDGRPTWLTVEFQTEPDSHILPRELGYYHVWVASQWKPTGPGVSVHIAVVHPTGSARQETMEMDWPGANGELGLRLAPTFVNLRDREAGQLLDDVAAGRATPVLLAFTPLLKGGGDQAITGKWIQRTGAITDDDLRNTVTHLTLVFAEKSPHASRWRAALEGWTMQKSEFLEQVRGTSLAQYLIHVLVDRFGREPDTLRRRIEPKTWQP